MDSIKYLYTGDDYNWNTNEVSFREILKYVNEVLNKDNYFILELDDNNIYLNWEVDRSRFATIYVDKVKEVIQYIKEAHNNENKDN